ncbi:Nedd8 activating enzyme E1 subunit 1 [Polychytrium aggregatum]|uniref:Nedd8 activating enzyme E1 subunit 1 n=1 Tax=Polychytrium aggregatum TaxID=110093 RepID=UPI0022FEC759|nr:Nedd8 activating enzyme E1 subunit 1 [Polychytrium aggregatum]KAI9199809.1 Nedd8 activating enzyme E1 subunit 1 [Polychytrium aggregatum]
MIDKKTQKYDRQLRLWQAHGQACLEDARVCLLNASVAGSETLKNLILPGIGSFTIVDSKLITGRDVGKNFFLTHDSIGKSKSQVMAEYLKELNDEVVGNFVDQDPVSLIDRDPSFFRQFSIVIATALPEASIKKLASICWDARIALVVLRTCGFFAHLRIAVPEHTVVESHPESVMDLRLDQPFPALIQFSAQFNMDQMDSHQKSHVPYVVILLQLLDEWKRHHNGELPSNAAERQKFKELIRKKQGDLLDPENFDEATQAVLRACTKTKIPSNILDILNDPEASDICTQSSFFWITARAVRDFVNNEGNGSLPLTGKIPDMKADTESFVALQTLYRNQAQADVAHISQRVEALLQSLPVKTTGHVHSASNPVQISNEEIARFCKNCQSLAVIRYRSLHDEFESAKTAEIQTHLNDLDNNLVYYILFRASELFFETFKRYPGEHHEDVETDIGSLKKCVVSLLTKLEIPVDSISDDHVHEMVRAGGSELHNIGAVMGGIASQEIIKLVTHQYIPVNNTLIYNGIKGTISVYTL